MLAYSSIEHRSLRMPLCYCQAAPSTYAIAHAICKMMLFLLAETSCWLTTPRISDRDVQHSARTACLWLFGLFAICGTPLRRCSHEYLLVTTLPPLLAILFLVLLFIVFAGISYACLSMTMGTPAPPPRASTAQAAAEQLTIVPEPRPWVSLSWATSPSSG